MKDGAWGLATGLIYNPGTYAKTDEIVALAKVAARHDGIYASHIRHEDTAAPRRRSRRPWPIGRGARLPVHISHIKASGKKAWGKSGRRRPASSRRPGQTGLEVTADQYPYIGVEHVAGGDGRPGAVPRGHRPGVPGPASTTRSWARRCARRSRRR